VIALRVVYLFSIFSFNDPATSEIYPLSLHDALPISQNATRRIGLQTCDLQFFAIRIRLDAPRLMQRRVQRHAGSEGHRSGRPHRSEEHTSELQSRFDLVCRLLLEKKKKNNQPR